MKLNVKKMACIVIAFSMTVSLAACKKSDKKSSDCTKAAESILDTVVSLNSKKIKKLEKEYGLEKELVDDLLYVSENEFVKAVMAKASFEIDEKSVKEKKTKASCDAIVKMPDFFAAITDADGDLDQFIDEIESQKEKKYRSIEVKLVFEVEDDTYTLTNGEDFLKEIFGDMSNVLPFDDYSDPTDDTLTPPDTKPVDTEPTDVTEPTDTEVTDTTEPADTSDDGGDSDDSALLRSFTPKKTVLNADTVSATLKISDPDAADSFSIDIDSATHVGEYEVMELGTGYSHSFSVMYLYYKFSSVADAKAYFDNSTKAVAKYATVYVSENDWGCCGYQEFGFTNLLYYSDEGFLNVIVTEGTEECVEVIPAFVEALCH